MNRRRAVAYMVLTALLWSAGGLLIKSVSLHPLALAGLRSVISAVFLLVAAGRDGSGRGPLRRLFASWSPPRAAGALAYAGVVILFVVATKLTTAANAILLQYTAPIYVALFSYWLLGERVSAVDWLTIGVVLGGLVLFFLDDLSTAGLWGNVLAILSGVCFAWVALLMRRQKEAVPLDSVILGNILAALICLPFIARSAPTAGDWLGLALLGIVQLGVSYLLYAAAVPYLTAVEIILIPVIEPVLNPLWVLLAVGEKPGPWALLGGVVVLAAVTFRGLHAARIYRAGRPHGA